MNSLDAIKKSESESFKKKNPHIFGDRTNPMEMSVEGVTPSQYHGKYIDGGEDDAEHDHIEALTKNKTEKYKHYATCPNFTAEFQKSKESKGAKKPKRIRQSEKPVLNKTESEYYRILILCVPSALPQSVRFKLATGCHYTPDFFSFPQMTAWEVKGRHAWEDSLIKLRMAAKVWPNIRWLLVWKNEATGQWQEQHVLP